MLLRRVESDERTKGGIIIPDTAKEKPQEGEVIAVGSGARDEQSRINALDVKAGDRVLFGKWSGTEIKVDGQDLLILTGRSTRRASRCWSARSDSRHWRPSSSKGADARTNAEMAMAVVARMPRPRTPPSATMTIALHT